jgi:hypothetical protein
MDTRMTPSKKQFTVRMSAKYFDRLAAIAARLNLPVSEVLIRASIIGLDCSDDLALEKRHTT